MKSKADKINLIPKSYKEAQKIKVKIWIMSVGLILEIILFITCIIYPIQAQKQIINKELDTVSLKLEDNRFKSVNQVIRQLEEAKIERDEWTQRYKALKQENFVSRRVLDSLLTRVPIGLTVNKLCILPIDPELLTLGETILVEGVAQDMLTILNYATLLEETYGIGTTDYKATYEERNNRYTYEINIHISKEDLETNTYTEEIEESNDGGESW